MNSSQRGSESATYHSVGDVGIVDIDDVQISYRRIVRGAETIVFIHGNSACKEVFHRQMHAPALKSYSLLALDLPGHGQSSDAAVPEDQYTIPGYARLIQLTLERLGIVRPLIVGWSLGGHIAIEMVGHGCDFSAAMIMGTPPAGPGIKHLAEAFRPSPVAAVTMSDEVDPEALRDYARAVYGSLDPVPQLFVDAAFRTDGRSRLIMGEHWSKGESGSDQRDVVAGWPRPICVVHGRDDEFVSSDYIDGLIWGNLWRDKVQYIEQVGHAAFVEAPELFNELLSEFAGDVFGS